MLKSSYTLIQFFPLQKCNLFNYTQLFFKIFKNTFFLLSHTDPELFLRRTPAKGTHHLPHNSSIKPNCLCKDIELFKMYKDYKLTM